MKTYIILWSLFLNLPVRGFQPVDINQASSEQIALLPGLGKSFAENLVKYRQQKGRITSEQDLLTISGMTEKKLAAIQGHIVFGKGISKLRVKGPPLEELSAEPTIPLLSERPNSLIDLASLEAKVLKIMGLEYDFETSMAKRARRSAWVPKISFIGDMGRHNAATEKALKDDKDASFNRSGNDFGLGIRASFDLPEVVFHSSEIDVARLQLKRLEAREKLMAQLHKSYFRYASLNEQLGIPALETSIVQLKNELRILSAELDSLSGGEFSRFQERNS